jgi:hypothetical protein
MRIFQIAQSLFYLFVAGKAQLIGVRFDQMFVLRSMRLMTAGAFSLLKRLVNALVLHLFGKVPVTFQAKLPGALSQQRLVAGVMCLMATQALPLQGRGMSVFLSPLLVDIGMAGETNLLRSPTKFRLLPFLGKRMTHVTLTLQEGGMSPRGPESRRGRGMGIMTVGAA